MSCVVRAAETRSRLEAVREGLSTEVENERLPLVTGQESRQICSGIGRKGGESMAHPMSFLATLSSSVLCRRSQSCLSLSSHGTRSLGAGHSSRQSSSRREMPSVSRVMDRLQVGTGHGA